jgi:S1-C subfamily serine protease
MRLRCVLFLCIISETSYCQNLHNPLTHVEACRKFSDAIIQVTTDQMSGTGFIVGADGWIVTALHVVADPDKLTTYGNPRVIIGNRNPIPAEIVSPLDKLASLRDFVILKINKTQLPKLDFGIEDQVELGSPISVIGFPLSAMLPRTANGTPVPKFCLTGTVAAQTAFPLGKLQFLHTIYFQGVSIKGISGAPIISLVTGKVIGIVSTRLTGINLGLAQQRELLNHPVADIVTGDFSASKSLRGIIDVLDEQLANGLGSGTGASDVAIALDKAKRDYKQQHPH